MKYFELVSFIGFASIILCPFQCYSVEEETCYNNETIQKWNIRTLDRRHFLDFGYFNVVGPDESLIIKLFAYLNDLLYSNVFGHGDRLSFKQKQKD